MKRKMQIIVGILMCVIVTGCASSQSRPLKIGIAIYKYEDTFMSFIKKSIEMQAEGIFEINMNDSEDSQTLQNGQVDTMISKGVDALAINLVDTKLASDIIKKAKKAKVPLIFFNREPSLDDINSYDDCWYVGTDSKEAGIIQGQLIAKSWKAHPEWDKNQDGTIQYVLLKGEEGHPDAEMRTEYVIKTLIQAGISVEKIQSASANWNSLIAKKMLDQWLEKHGDSIEYVISNNDTMALGALASLQNAGYFSNNKFMPIVGVDAIPEMLTKIEQGIIVGTVLNDSYNQSKAIVEILNNIGNGKNPVEGTNWLLDENKAVRIPYIPITQENAKIAKDSYSY